MKTFHPFTSAAFAALLAVALFSAAGCHKQSASAKSVFPEATGWARSGEVRTFAGDDLSNYIDGDAEKYLKAGFKSVSTADYKFQEKTQVVVDVYTMSTPTAAKAIFESEPPSSAQTVSLGNAARLYSQSLIFRKGPYLVRMVAYQESPALPQGMMDLGRALEGKLSR